MSHHSANAIPRASTNIVFTWHLLYMYSDDGRAGDRVADLLLHSRGTTNNAAHRPVEEPAPLSFLSRLWRGVLRLNV